MEKKLRAKLEDEVKELRSALAAQKLASTAMAASGSTDQLGNAFSVSGQASAESLEELRRKFSEAEEKVSAHNDPGASLFLIVTCRYCRYILKSK